MTRVPVIGNKLSIVNKSEIFDQEVKSLLSKAAKGDIYIFDEIIISCNGNLADDKASTLVYIIK
jgi:recombinational DNA repair protein RecR